MKIAFKTCMYFCFLFVSCSSVNEGFNSTELTSSTGEHIYINSINYGVTGDHQLSIITKNKYKLKYKTDTEGTVSGLNPFYYSFRNDSLTLYFNDTITYKMVERLESITVSYKKVDNSQYMKIVAESNHRSTYLSVPNRKPLENSTMPLPPSSR